MNDFVVSMIRTIVPMLVGFLANFLLQIGVDIDSVTLIAFLTTLFSGLYYALARWLESQFPALRFLLGASHVPTYAPTTIDTSNRYLNE